ncbi:MAG: sugar ABC transporter permease, partial [Roseiflexus sp.]|nr:sugar ABC transporter permease [Roseiflexus sp.]
MRQAKTLSAHPARQVRWMNRDRAIALLMIAPSALAIAVFVYGFIGWTAYISMTDWRGLMITTSFVGFENYLTIFNTGRFQTNIRNLIVFTVFFLASC